jgi:hypothetical protein
MSLIAVFGLCDTAAARQDPGGLDPESREDLRRSIERHNPDLDPEAIREILRRIEATPKLRCAIEAITVYTDGIVCRATLTSDIPFACRVSFLGRSLSPVYMAHLTDRRGNEWEVPPLRNHYSWVRLTEAWTMLVERGKSIHFVHVEKLESPRLVRSGPAVDDEINRPTELHYSIHTYGVNAYTADLKKPKSIYLIGRGTAPIEWKDAPVPGHLRTRATDAPSPPK